MTPIYAPSFDPDKLSGCSEKLNCLVLEYCNPQTEELSTTVSKADVPSLTHAGPPVRTNVSDRIDIIESRQEHLRTFHFGGHVKTRRDGANATSFSRVRQAATPSWKCFRNSNCAQWPTHRRPPC
jgi:hypothetical protein